jgi:hypothetical protein
MTSGLGAGAIADAIHCYPTRSEIVKRLGDAFNRRRLTPRLLGFSRMLMKWRRR